MKWLYRLVLVVAGASSFIFPAPAWLLKYGWIILWSGVALLAVREIVAVGNDLLFVGAHRRMTKPEAFFHLSLIAIFVVIGFLLNLLLPHFGMLALAIQAALVEEVDTQRLLIFLLRASLVRHLHSGRISSAQAVGARLFDLMLINGIASKTRSAYLAFGKSAMALANLRETLGDFRSAALLYGWARERFMKAGLRRNKSLQLKVVVPMIRASCGMIRTTAFINPVEAAEQLRLTERLSAQFPLPEVAAMILMVGGRVSAATESMALASSGETAVETIIRKYSLPALGGIGLPTYEQLLAATTLAQRFNSRGDNEEALKIAERVSRYLRGHTDIRFVLLRIEMEELRSDLLSAKTDSRERLSILEEVIETIKEHLFERAHSGNETELMLLSNVASEALTRFVGAMLIGIREQHLDSRHVLSTIVQFKGIAGWVRTNLTRALSIELEDGFQKEARKLSELRNKMAEFWTNSNSKSIDFDLDRLEGERLESFLVRGRLGEEWLSDMRSADIRSVCECLHSGEILLAFATARNLDGTMTYVVFPCTVKDENIFPIEIGPTDLIDTAISQWRILAQLGANPSPDEEITSFLQSRLIAPLLDVIQSATRVVVVCDTNLSFFPFEAFCDEDGEVLIKSHEWVYCSSFREILLRRSRGRTLGGRSVVFAAPQYDSPAETSTGNDGETTFRPLAFARVEGSNIAKCIDADLFVGAEATAGQLKRVRQPCLLHIATHAFAFDQQFSTLNSSGVAPSAKWKRISMADDPMLRSGLAMTGINAAIRGERLPPDCEDGLLSAWEACAMNLANTDLVVLSACDTGMGQIHNGEGVLGLKRAFMTAGAGTIIASLWRVPDEQTCEIMTEFYKNVSNGCTYAGALRQAKLVMMLKHPQPLYWAGFGCYGLPHSSHPGLLKS